LEGAGSPTLRLHSPVPLPSTTLIKGPTLVMGCNYPSQVIFDGRWHPISTETYAHFNHWYAQYLQKLSYLITFWIVVLLHSPSQSVSSTFSRIQGRIYISYHKHLSPTHTVFCACIFYPHCFSLLSSPRRLFAAAPSPFVQVILQSSLKRLSV